MHDMLCLFGLDTIGYSMRRIAHALECSVSSCSLSTALPRSGGAHEWYKTVRRLSYAQRIDAHPRIIKNKGAALLLPVAS